MAWYNTGTIALTNGSATVTGSGTNFSVGAQIGEALYAPDGKLYEIQTINSATVITLASNYLGSTASAQGYQIIPTQSLVADLASDVTDLISDFADVRDYAGNGKFNDGAVGTPGITFTQDQDNGLYRIGSNNWALAAGGQKIVDISTSGINVTGAGTFSGAVTATGNLLNFNSGAGNAPYIQHASNSLDIRGGTGSTRFLNNAASQATVSIRDTGNVSGSGLDLVGTFTTTGAATFSGIVTANGLTVSNASGGNVAAFTNTSSADLSINLTSGVSLITPSTGILAFGTSSTERLRLDAGGSVLIGKTTPADLHNTWNHIIIGEKGAIISENGAGGIDGITLADNAYIDSDTGTYAYQTTAAASLILQSGGVTTFSNAASGSAGAALTPVPRMTLDASGHAIIPAGVTLGTAAGVYAAANTLEDYEEGTHAATLNMTSGSVGYGTNVGTYVKVGNQVTYTAWIAINSVSSPSGALNITLPFAIPATVTRPASMFVANNMTSVTGNVGGWINPNTATLYLVTVNGGDMAALNGENLAGTTELYITITYNI
jgi:hypothetical protein